MPIPSTLGWYEVPATTLRSVQDPLYSAMNFAAVCTAWSGGTFDTLRNRIVVFGGGHGDYYGNEIYVVDIDGTPVVQRITNSSTGGCSASSCDGGVTPNSRHTYDGLTYIQNSDKMFVFGGGQAGNGFFQNDTWVFDFVTLTWTRKFPSGPTPNNGLVMTDYDSVSGLVFQNDLSSLYTYNLATNVRAIVGSASGTVLYYCCGVIDPTRRRFFAFGGGESGYYDISGGASYNRHAYPTAGTQAVTNAGYPGLAYDPDQDRIVAWIGGDSVYVLNIDTGVWTQNSSYSGGPGSAQANGTYGRWQYSATTKVFVVVNSVDQNAYTLRLTSGTPDTTAPTTPASPSATAISQSRIDVAWSASTDAVGVTGYPLERCQGAACSSFAQIATPVGTSYSDTGLTAGTLYRYRVRATDAAGNLSAYSSIVEATTSAADTTAPTDPASLAATAASYQQINLTWTASTDAVGVTGYLVERGLGAGGAFAQVAVAPTNSFSNIGLTQNTLYRYRVRATDAAGNLSGYSNTASATTLASPVSIVGSGQTFTTIAAAVAVAVNGDIIEAAAGIYANEYFTLSQLDITLRGVGGYAHLKWDTGNNITATTNIPNGKGIINFTGSGNLEYLEFSGANVADENGAGIRYDGGDLTISHCYFHNNEQGILGQSPSLGSILTMEYSRFDANGQCPGGSCSHNIYIGYMTKVVMQYCESINSIDGHCFKSRAAINYLLYNHLGTKGSNGSLEIEFPNGHQNYVIGNVIEQGVNTDNSTIISFGAEGLTTFADVTHELYVINNTFYNWRPAGATFIQFVNTAAYAKIMNNARNTGGTFRVGTATTLVESNNVIQADAEWVNINTTDFHLVTTSSAINAGASPGIGNGTEAFALTPTHEYKATADQYSRATVDALDAGAYEFGRRLFRFRS